jgi:hypothetical protein
MAKNSKKNGVVELWGHEFKKAAEGLDKGEVVSFVDELMKEKEALLKRAEHLSSLTKLAEKTIVEADDVAKQVKGEAEEQAKAEAKTILAEAEGQAQKLIEEKRAEALAKVNREVEAIKAKAQQQAETMLEEKTREIQPELKKNIKGLYGELLSQLENLKQQVVALEEELDQKLPQPPEKTSVVEEKSSAVEETSQAGRETSQASNEFLELLQPASETGEDKPEWELEVLPPIDLTQILEIINYLDSLSEVKQTELIPQIDRPTITVFLSEPVHLIDVLKELPQVAQVTEDKSASNGPDVKPRKARIELSRKIASTPSN